jgi:hypothetical protein
MKCKLVVLAAAFSAVGGILGTTSAAVITRASDSVIGVTLQDSEIVVCGEGDIPEGEQPASAFDDDIDTKYLNFQKYNTGVIVSPFQQFPLTSVEFISANDAPERNPSSFSIYGSSVADSTDFSAYTPILLNHALAEFPGFGSSSGVISVSSSSAFASYLIVFPTIVDGYDPDTESGANSMQIAEIRLQGDANSAVPEPSSLALIALGSVGVLTRRRLKRVA